MSNRDHMGASEGLATVGASVSSLQNTGWGVRGRVEKYWAGIDEVYSGNVEPYEVVETTGNLLLCGGGDVMWLGLTGGISASSGLQNTKFDNGNASIGVGNSTSAAVNTQTGLQANSSRRYHKGMDATYPVHTTGTNSTAFKNIQFKATFSTAQANFAWQEWCIRNSTLSSGAGRCLNRKVQSLGTKSSAATWAFTVTISLA